MIADEQRDPRQVGSELPLPPPNRNQVNATLARYARLARETEGSDQGDVAAALRDDIEALAPARLAATRRLLNDE